MLIAYMYIVFTRHTVKGITKRDYVAPLKVLGLQVHCL